MRHHHLFFLPLLIEGVRLGVRVILNLWDMIEP